MTDITIYHNARCSNSRGALALLRERGIEPAIVDYIAQPLDEARLTALVARLGVPVRDLLRSKEAAYQELGLGDPQRTDAELIAAIAAFANGDARTALNVLEMAVTNGTITPEKTIVTRDILEQCISKKSLLYDKNGEEHYNLISALHKSMRNSDPDAAVYWLARMLEAGEDPLDLCPFFEQACRPRPAAR